ncbi:MAG: lysine transporter LysE [Rickettsiales bacterium]|jgi:homoserine/homoserine lactone efflux protein|nr:lysine transporter LysE [Rickettsiales bacterium]
MPTEWWVSLIFAMFAIAISPGNGALLSMRYGLKGGVAYASPAIIGLQLGLLGVYSLVLLSLMLSTRISPSFLDGIALLGGTYLLYLGGRDLWKAWKHHDSPSPLATHIHVSAGKEAAFKRISIGTFTNLTNPKGIVFMVAFFPQWLHTNAPWSLTQQAIAMGCVAVTIDTFVMHFYAYLASIIRRLLGDPSLFRIVEIILAALLCCIGGGMIMMRFL